MKDNKCKNCEIELWIDEDEICEFCEEDINMDENM